MAARAASKVPGRAPGQCAGFCRQYCRIQAGVSVCVSGTGANCRQRVVYVFDVKAKVRDVDVQKGRAQVQISEVTSLGNEKGAPSQAVC